MSAMLLCLLALPSHTADASPSAYGEPASSAPPTTSFLSRTLGSGMVLQRAPQRAVVWGHVAAGTTVSTTMTGGGAHQLLTTVAGGDGIWRQALPAVPASPTPHKLAFKASTGETAAIENVLFGDVYLCGGQSNMQFSMPVIENSTQEIARADGYPLVRLFTVGQKTSSKVPLPDLQTVEQSWSVASAKTVANSKGFGYFSAVCWIFGREVFDALGGQTPVGLISSNWGGTPVESWTTPEVLRSCNLSTVDSTLYNSMIHPYTVGPMALVGFAWYQGEANVDERRGDEGAARYACTFPGMIRQWRRSFARPTAYFGFVQLSTWCGNGELIAEMRTVGQMAALALPKVGYATNADHGAGCNIHPPPKQYCGKRLANSALALEYGRDVAWRSPSFASQVASAAPPSIKISLSDVSAAGLRDDVYPFNYLGGAFNCSAQAGKCAWAELLLADGSWVNATLSLAGGSALTLTASAASAASAGAPLASRYGWGAVPMLSLYDRGTGLPVLPWYENITAGKARDGGRAAAAATVAAAEAKEAEAVAAVTAGVDCHASRFPGLCCTSRPSEQTCLAANCRWSHEGCDIEQEDRATCSAIGDCGKAYEACCAGFAAKGFPCGCHLQDGSGAAGAGCGDCGTAFSACCLGFKAKGYPCKCDVH